MSQSMAMCYLVSLVVIVKQDPYLSLKIGIGYIRYQGKLVYDRQLGA